MFGWGSGLALPSATSEPEKERRPPADPTPLDFPVYNLSKVLENESESRLMEMSELLANIKRPQDICIERFKPLNLQLDTDVEVANMIPEDHSHPLAPLPWEDTTEPTEDNPQPLMDNGAPYPSKERYEILEKELALDNDDAFREVARLPPREGRSRVRITQSRKFWTGLERMAQYWDTSLDNYYERPATPEPTPSERERAGDDTMQMDAEDSKSRYSLTDGPMDLDEAQTAAPLSNNAVGDGHQPSVPVYTGRRIGNGAEMPDEMRDETIRSFVEMVAWPFGCQVTAPTLPPRLTTKNLLFPVRQTFQSSRSPRDRQIARSGMLEGPVLISQCRSETSFRTADNTPGTGIGEVSDLFREVGGMLLAAQERAREGAVEKRPGEGKWWTMEPRFGGAPNDGILDDLINKGHGMSLPDSMMEEIRPSAQEAESDSKRHKFEHPFVTSLSRKPSAMRRLTSSEKWKILQPGPSLWDKRMSYLQIGKVQESPFDDIYMISSINHHISILHLRVHRRYLDILTNGDSTFPATEGEPWHVLKLQRTRWFDLLDANDRIEALKGVWQLFQHQLRQIHREGDVPVPIELPLDCPL
ncbi:hypothetical protein N7517_007969 [Penicillium concentricum]|uniref:Uncharacterized protein n=1 Tax=Penicillium concentricum TaxID=293559 RepID=A0A9W9RWF8_9EURO|nr:uncharacterized protein N7517_007969 [Penicillium concentricum]KAJ5365083.1 hypothetical protein N7517_007969 [Penicillium concentricum]